MNINEAAIQKLIELYVRKIRAQMMKVDDVPWKWREIVRRKLEATE